MIELTININEKDIESEIVKMAAKDVVNTIPNRMERNAISDAIKEIVYANKDEIIQKCIDKASKELVRKGLPKLLESFNEQE